MLQMRFLSGGKVTTETASKILTSYIRRRRSQYLTTQSTFFRICLRRPQYIVPLARSNGDEALRGPCIFAGGQASSPSKCCVPLLHTMPTAPREVPELAGEIGKIVSSNAILACTIYLDSAASRASFARCTLASCLAISASKSLSLSFNSRG